MSLRTQRGSLLVITLWVIIILGALSVAIARHLSREIRLTKYRLAREQARVLARSGIYLAMRTLQQDAKDSNEAHDWLADDWALFPTTDSQADPTVWVVPLPGGGSHDTQRTSWVEIQMLDEERKLNINAASATQLDLLIHSPALAQAIVDYRDPDSDGGPAESSIETPPYYYPKNAPIAALEELRALHDMTDDVFSRLQEFTYGIPGADQRLMANINTASREVLQAVGLITLADQIVTFREEGHYFTKLNPTVEADVPPPFDPSTNTEFQNALNANRLTVASQVFLVKATGHVAVPPVHYHVEAVVQRSPDGADVPHIIAWREG